LSWVKETKQPHKKFKVDWFGGIYPDIPPVATPLATAAPQARAKIEWRTNRKMCGWLV